jgi:molybdopterin-containing oxidoreductase family iron-sulfur binding subunit
MNLADIRTRLAGLEGRAYWRSLEELADTDDFRTFVDREFPAQASEFTDPAGRRQFLKLMGASLALAGVSACTRQPQEKIVPYVRQPEEIVPGRPLFFATAMPLGGYGQPLLAENHMGRPTKLEGNPEHPASLGATDILGQAAVLTLYDPDRSRNIIGRGETRTWTSFVTAMQAAINSQHITQGQTLRLLTEPISSPSLLSQIQMLRETFPNMKWHQWDPVFGAPQGGAPAESAVCHFSQADVVVSLDADFLGCGPGAIRYSKDFASRRRIGTPQDQQNRLYVVEPTPTITGAKAEHRLAMKARDIHAIAAALANAVGAGGAAASGLPDNATRWIQAAAADLQARRGRAVVVAGDEQPAAVHTLARAINAAIGAVGTTVTYMAPIPASPADGTRSIAELVADMNNGQVELLVIIGANPVFTAPADLKFTEALDRVPLRVHMGLYHDETAELCHWHIPEAHFLETWGDVRSFDGTATLIQPLVAPLYDGRNPLEILAILNGAPGQPPMDLVKEYWTRVFDGGVEGMTVRTRDGQPFASADALWRTALHDGFIASTSMIKAFQGAGETAAPATAQPTTPAPAPVQAAAAAPTPAPAPPNPTGMEILFRPDPHVLDGRFINNGWLQELPRPLSKITWDTAAYVSVQTADRLGVVRGDVVEIRYNNATARLPIWVMPGTADDVIVVHFGYGRRRTGRVGTGLGTDTFGLRTSAAPWFDGGVQVTPTGDSYVLASTQNHFSMDRGTPVRVVTADQYRTDPASVAAQGHNRPPEDMTLYHPGEHPHSRGAQHRWAMAIDLNACTGCGVCVAACVAENNIPVVGKSQIERSREMHWIRVDTYFEGDPAAPEATYHQPVPCMQCESAPCEPVCPVAATVHSDEGLNDMVYNRCVGTRYCSNNCPYKVRRFNFMLYSDFSTPELMGQRNPDVTIRSRGVMEKCTYCVQRINHARIDEKTTGQPIRDGDIKTACQQACPADAIVFGDLNDPASRVVQLKAQQRNYGLQEDLNTRPRTTYLAVVKNPNPDLQKG